MKNIETTSPTGYLNDSSFDGYRAAPLLIHGPEADMRLIARQNQLAANFVTAVHEELTGSVRPPIIEFVANSIVMRMKEREGLNSMSYMRRYYRAVNFAAVPECTRSVVNVATHKALIGEGTVLQNSIAGRAYGMDSVELANLTVINGLRSELVLPMWEEVSLHVNDDVRPRGADDYDSIEILGFDRDISKSDHIGAIRISMKRRLLGRATAGRRVKARTFAAIDTSPSSQFNQKTVDRLVYAAKTGQRLSQNAVTWLLATELPTARILAQNDTVYEVR